MPHLLSIFRAARLVGTTRGALQKRIHDGELVTFEGMLKVDDLLRLYPGTDLHHDTEFERVEKIKATAFAKRVRERTFPDPAVLMTRFRETAQELAASRLQLNHYQAIVEQLQARLAALAKADAGNGDVQALGAWLQTALAETPVPHEAARRLLAQDAVLRVMAAHVTLHPSGHEYWLEGNDSLLEAGLRAGLALNYGCTDGKCGLCKARVVTGRVIKTLNHDYVLSEAEKGMNYILLCSNTAANDVVIEALEASDESDIPLQELTAKVKSVEFPNQDLLLLHLQTPRIQRLRFLAGQSVTLTSPQGRSINLPIASCPCDDRNLLFHVRRKADNPAVAALFQVHKGDEIQLQGPQGDFLLDEDSPRTQLFLAHETGFAPIKSLLEHAMARDTGKNMYLYWQVQEQAGLYAHNLCRAWHDALENFHYHGAVSEPAVEHLLAQHPRLKDCDVYVAGPLADVERDAEQLQQAGLPAVQLKVEVSD
jgi:CDP-4-dehydro-6-deoxyglucose reductase